MFLSLLKQQWNISINFWNFISFLKWMCPTKMLFKSLSINEYLLVVHNLTQRTVKFFQNLLCLWAPWVLLSRSQLVRNHSLVSLPKKQQDDMVQPFGHFRWSLKRQSPDHSVQTADDNRKVTSRVLQLTLVLYIFKLLLYFNSFVISNQIIFSNIWVRPTRGGQAR